MATSDTEAIEKAAEESDAASDTESGESEYDSECDYDIVSMSGLEDLNDVLTESTMKDFNEEVKNMRKSIKVVCGGPTGVGKSTLLNGLMGVDKFSDELTSASSSLSSASFSVEHSLDHGTVSVAEQTFVKNGIEIVLYDTPGLEGCNDTDDAYLKEIKEKCGDYDLFLYCINSTETRDTELFDKKSSLVKFTKLFGVKLWNNAAVILTQANGLVSDYEEEKQVDEDFNVEAAFKKRIKEWRKKIRKELIKMGVRKRKAKKVPILPAGSAIHPNLPGHPYWLGRIFEKVTDQMKYKAKMAYIQYSIDRLKRGEEANADEISGEEIGKQPFVVSHKFKWLAALSTVGGGVTAAMTGGGIGATVGALAIGIPSFGVFAGVGLALGAVLGAAVGGGSAMATAMAYRYFKKRKMRKQKTKKPTTS